MSTPEEIAQTHLDRPRIDIEPSMETAVRAMAGEVLSDRFGPSPKFKNADYYFAPYGVIAELKCLTEDGREDAEVGRKLRALMARWHREGKITNPDRAARYGRALPMSERMAMEMFSIMKTTMRRRIIKANNQIKDTAEALGLTDYRGLVILANDGDFGINPGGLVFGITKILGTEFSRINTVLLMSANMNMVIPDSGRTSEMWAVCHRTGRPEVSDELLDKLQGAWMAQVEKQLGAPVKFDDSQNMEGFYHARYLRNVMDR